MKRAIITTFTLLCLTAPLAWDGGCAEAPINDVATGRVESEILFKSVYFAFDSASLTPAARTQLKIVAKEMMKQPEMHIVLRGHTDGRGSAEYSEAVSERSARSVFRYLNSLGVAEQRMTVEGWGNSKPADPRHNKAAWAKNRRVEIVVQSNLK